MRHKNYNKRIEFHQRSYEEDELEDKKRTGTSLVKTVWAKVQQMSYSKTVQYDQVPMEDLIEIKMHYPMTFNVQKDHLVKHNGVFYQILSMPESERRKELAIEAKRYD